MSCRFYTKPSYPVLNADLTYFGPKSKLYSERIIKKYIGNLGKIVLCNSFISVYLDYLKSNASTLSTRRFNNELAKKFDLVQFLRGNKVWHPHLWHITLTVATGCVKSFQPDKERALIVTK